VQLIPIEEIVSSGSVFEDLTIVLRDGMLRLQTIGQRWTAQRSDPYLIDLQCRRVNGFTLTTYAMGALTSGSSISFGYSRCGAQCALIEEAGRV